MVTAGTACGSQVSPNFGDTSGGAPDTDSTIADTGPVKFPGALSRLAHRTINFYGAANRIILAPAPGLLTGSIKSPSLVITDMKKEAVMLFHVTAEHDHETCPGRAGFR